MFTEDAIAKGSVWIEGVASAFELESLVITWRARGGFRLSARQVSTGGSNVSYTVDLKRTVRDAVLELGDMLLKTASGERAESIRKAVDALRAEG